MSWNRDEIAKKIFIVAFSYGKQDLDLATASATIDALQALYGDRTAFQVIDAYDQYLKDVKNKFFPTPVSLRPYLYPELDDAQKAREVASRVVAAVSKFGWANPEEAKEYIGSVGWHVVKRYGGWKYICENLGVDLQISTFQAQVRDIAEVTIKSDKIGTFDQPIQIEEKVKTEGLVSSGDVMKLINKKRDE